MASPGISDSQEEILCNIPGWSSNPETVAGIELDETPEKESDEEKRLKRDEVKEKDSRRSHKSFVDNHERPLAVSPNAIFSDDIIREDSMQPATQPAGESEAYMLEHPNSRDGPDAFVEMDESMLEERIPEEDVLKTAKMMMSEAENSLSATVSTELRAVCLPLHLETQEDEHPEGTTGTTNSQETASKLLHKTEEVHRVASLQMKRSSGRLYQMIDHLATGQCRNKDPNPEDRKIETFVEENRQGKPFLSTAIKIKEKDRFLRNAKRSRRNCNEFPTCLLDIVHARWGVSLPAICLVPDSE